MSRCRTSGGEAELSEARNLVARSLSDQNEAVRDAAVLVVDECVADAVRHGGGHFELTVQRGQRSLRVEVIDDNRTWPVLVPPDPDREGGWGLAIVDRLTTRWGTRDVGTNEKMVWFELNLD